MTVYAGGDVEEEEHASMADGSENLYDNSANQYGGFSGKWE